MRVMHNFNPDSDQVIRVANELHIVRESPIDGVTVEEETVMVWRVVTLRPYSSP